MISPFVLRYRICNWLQAKKKPKASLGRVTNLHIVEPLTQKVQTYTTYQILFELSKAVFLYEHTL